MYVRLKNASPIALKQVDVNILFPATLRIKYKDNVDIFESQRQFKI